MDDKIIDFTNKLNEKSSIINIDVPVLDGFKIIPNEGTLFTAMNDKGYVEQFLFDGILGEDETFDEHIEKVINETKKSMKDASLEYVDDSFNYCRDCVGKYFFKLYIQDNIFDNKIIRQINVYFMDEETRGFYEITFASCPYSLDDVDFVDNDLISEMLNTVYELLSKIK